MRKIMLTIFSLILLGTIFISGSYALAAPSASSQQEAMDQLKAAGGASGANISGSGPMDPRILVAVLIRASLAFVGIFFVGMITYAGFLWMTAGGEDDKISTAKKLISNGIIGFTIVLSAYSITYFILRSLLGATASYGNPFSYGSTSNVTNFGPNPGDYGYSTK